MITEERIKQPQNDLETVIDIKRYDILRMSNLIRDSMNDKDEYPIEIVEKAAIDWLEKFIDNILVDASWYAWGDSSTTHAPDFNKFLLRATKRD